MSEEKGKKSKKYYLDNAELEDEIVYCIDRKYNIMKEKGYTGSRQEWVADLCNYDDDKIDKIISRGEITKDECKWIKSFNMIDDSDSDDLIKPCKLTYETISYLKELDEQFKTILIKPNASEKLGKMFFLIVENQARSFFWSNPDDGDDCKANALHDLCLNFWKFKPGQGQAFAFCSQIAYFGIAGAKRILYPKKYEGTVSLTCIDDNGNNYDMYNL